MVLARRQLIIIGASLLTVVLLVTIVYFFTSREKTPPAIFTLGNLPSSAPATATSRTSTSTQQLPPHASPVTTPDTTQYQAAVTVGYVRSNTFSLTIDAITRTIDRPSSKDIVPPKDGTSSILQLLGEDGSVLAQTAFAMTTAAILEGPQQSQNPTYALPQSSNRIVLAVPLPKQPAKVVIKNSVGTILAQQSFVWNSLPIDNSGLQATLRQPTVWTSILATLFQPIQVAFAQSSGDITLVVINEVGGEGNLDTVYAQAQAMTSLVEPWITFANKVRVVEITNKQSLGCVPKNFGLGEGFLVCPNSGLIASIVARQVPSWSAIIVATKSNCDCGSVGLDLPPITTVGGAVAPSTLVHELGHAMGKMRDEYLYQFGSSGNPDGPNCFDSQASCQQAISTYPDGQCSLGCSNSDGWRPSTLIMHNTYDPLDFGPVERCIMGKALAAISGDPYDCTKHGNNSGSSANSSLFYGWHR
jgi:hypothetical protein